MGYSLTNNLKKTQIDNMIIYLSFLSVFAHYSVPIIFLILSSFYIALFRKNKGNFKRKHIICLLVFTFYSAIVGLLNKNFNGFAYSVGLFLIIYFCVWVKNTITNKVLENALTLCCLAGLLTSIICIAEKVILILSGVSEKHRSTLYFFNCNYLATVLAIVVIICAYKFIFKKANRLICMLIALLCAVSIYLTGSLFAWIEVLVGIAVLLRATRRHQLLSILMLTIATVCIILYFAPEIIPRPQDIVATTNNRVGIWKTSIDIFKKSPIFGRGFMAYKHLLPLYPGGYKTSHSHNIVLESLMDFGFIGSILLSIYIINYFKRLFVCRGAQSKTFFSSLILALLIGLIAHGTTDLTFIWTQTGFLYALLMCGIGPEEKLLKINENGVG